MCHWKACIRAYVVDASCNWNIFPPFFPTFSLHCCHIKYTNIYKFPTRKISLIVKWTIQTVYLLWFEELGTNGGLARRAMFSINSIEKWCNVITWQNYFTAFCVWLLWILMSVPCTLEMCYKSTYAEKCIFAVIFFPIPVYCHTLLELLPWWTPLPTPLPPYFHLRGRTGQMMILLLLENVDEKSLFPFP